MRPLILLLTFIIMSAVMEIHAQKRALSPEMLWQVGRVSLDCVSPDGSMAIYGVRRYNVKENNSTRTLYLIDLKTQNTQPITDPDKTSVEASFHPSGKRIGFLQGGKLYEVPVDKPGTAKQVTSFEVNGYKYAPNGRYILFAQDVKFDQTPTEQYPDLPQATGKIIDGLFYRHWKSWHDYKYSNIFYIEYKDGQTVGSATNIMNEPYDSPLRPFGGMEQVNWSPDGRFIVYTCRKMKGTDETQSTNSDLYLYELASGKTANITEGMSGYDLEPVFSPNGRYLAWTSMKTAGYEADRPRLMLLDTRTNQRSELSENWNFEVNHPQWSASGNELFFLSSDDFTYQVHAINIQDKKIRKITTGQHNYTNIMVAGDQLLTTRVSMTTPAEVYLVNSRSGTAKKLSSATDNPWQNVIQSKVERRNVKTTDGEDMNVWVLFPPGYESGKKYPALLYCQGGPQSAVSQFFSYRWNLQLMAAQGYVIIAPCRRGMPGGPKGQDWNTPISGDWGGQAMKDLLSASDALAKESFVDENKMGAVGASFGGYSVFWLAGNHNKRFKTFISHCGMFNTTSWYGTTEEMWFANYDLGGPYWENPTADSWSKFSPHRYVQNWDTPILIMHNELDFRVPFSEGMQAFQAAQLRGIPSRLVTFPDEGHWMSTPQNSLMWQREYFRWLETYLK